MAKRSTAAAANIGGIHVCTGILVCFAIEAEKCLVRQRMTTFLAWFHGYKYPFGKVYILRATVDEAYVRVEAVNTFVVSAVSI